MTDDTFIDYKIPKYRVQLLRESGPSRLSPRLQIRCPQDPIPLLRQLLDDREREQLVVLFMDSQNRVIGVHIAAIGIIDSCLVNPPEIIRAALLAVAPSILIAHQHPSGDCTPSSEDKRITERMAKACELMGIALIDHVVLGEEGRFHSFKQAGVI